MAKYIYLPISKEEHDFKKDLVRLGLVAYQMLNSVKIQKYHFTF